jgi:hypothetical protein
MALTSNGQGCRLSKRRRTLNSRSIRSSCRSIPPISQARDESRSASVGWLISPPYERLMPQARAFSFITRSIAATFSAPPNLASYRARLLTGVEGRVGSSKKGMNLS